MRPAAHRSGRFGDAWGLIVRRARNLIGDEEGFLFVVDRLKELINFKGYQVPPAELEAVLIGHAAIADAAVVSSPEEDAGEVPKAR